MCLARWPRLLGRANTRHAVPTVRSFKPRPAVCSAQPGANHPDISEGPLAYGSARPLRKSLHPTTLLAASARAVDEADHRPRTRVTMKSKARRAPRMPLVHNELHGGTR